jgi:hypothetical protein
MEHQRTHYGCFDPTDEIKGLSKSAPLENMKEWRKETARIRRVVPRLFLLMLQYLSKESLEATQR